MNVNRGKMTAAAVLAVAAILMDPAPMALEIIPAITETTMETTAEIPVITDLLRLRK